jgi:hypothetical protein
VPVDGLEVRLKHSRVVIFCVEDPVSEINEQDTNVEDRPGLWFSNEFGSVSFVGRRLGFYARASWMVATGPNTKLVGQPVAMTAGVIFSAVRQVVQPRVCMFG